jgi:hypothetical protein
LKGPLSWRMWALDPNNPVELLKIKQLGPCYAPFDTPMKSIFDFIEAEHTQFENAVLESGFVTAWQAVDRYHTFLSIVLKREAEATAKYSADVKALPNTPPSPGRYLTDEQRFRLDELDKSSDALHLEIESFYLFAKILLDTIARAIEKVFGQGQKCTLDSHHDLIDNFEQFAEQKKLTFAGNFIEKAKSLRENISNFRDHEIAHGKRLNRITATALTRDGRATIIATSTVVPQDRLKPQASSIHVAELMRLLEDYILSAIEIVRTNWNNAKIK